MRDDQTTLPNLASLAGVHQQRWAELLAYLLAGLTPAQAAVAMGLPAARVAELCEAIAASLREFQ